MLKFLTKVAQTQRNFAKYFTKSHEYVCDQTGRIGISDHAQHAMGEVIHVEMTCQVGDQVEAGATFAEIESVKSVSNCYFPCSGVVKAINKELSENPKLVNQDAEGKAWIVQIEKAVVDGLLDTGAYKLHVEEEMKNH